MQQVGENTCIICGNAGASVAFDNGTFRVNECNNCKFGKISPVPDAGTLAALYNSPEYFNTHMHYDYVHLPDAEIQNLMQEQGRLHFNYLKKYQKANSTLLEIGCGYGLQLAFLKEMGFAVQGIEFSENGAQFCNEKLNVPVVHSAFENYNDEKQYDIVMLNHVLEHFTDLHAAMRKICSLIKPGGILYIRVPNHDSYDRRKSGNQWPAYLPFHISYFSEKSLRMLFRQYHFEDIQISEYIADVFMQHLPAPMQQFAKRIAARLGFTKQFNGRTITIIGKYAG